MKSQNILSKLVHKDTGKVLAGSYPFVRFVPLEGDELLFKINSKDYSGIVDSRTIDARSLALPMIVLHLTDVREI